MSPLAKSAEACIRLLHPDWEILFFDDGEIRQFVAKEFPSQQKVMEEFRYPIQRIDFFRYLAIYRLGGFYLDTDVLLDQSLAPLLDSSCVFPFEELTISKYLRHNLGIDWEIGNYAFGAEAGNSFLAAVIENCVKAQREPKWVETMMTGIPKLFRPDFEVLNSTGPGLLTRTLAENQEAASELTVLFPADVCDKRTWDMFGEYGVHLMDGSWRAPGSYLHRRALSWWESRTQRRLLAESRRSGGRRTFPANNNEVATPGDDKTVVGAEIAEWSEPIQSRP